MKSQGSITERLRIRKMVAEDAFQIAGLLTELGYPNTPAFAETKIAKLSRSSSDTVLVAEVDGKVVGAAHLHIAELFHEPGRLGRIMTLVVTKNHRGCGVGRKLMNSLETTGRKTGCIKMEITSGGYRGDAHTFYKGLGYVERPKRFVKVLQSRANRPGNASDSCA